jgi:hypothetical protein
MAYTGRSLTTVTLVAALIAGTAFAARPAMSATLNWTLQDVSFDDSGTASGTFSTNSTTGFATAFDIATTTGSVLPGVEYNSTTAYIDTTELFDDEFVLRLDSSSQFFILSFKKPLTGATPDALFPGLAQEFNIDLGLRTVTAGDAVLAATPLPVTLPLFAGGFGLVGLFGMRKKSKDVTLGPA